VAAAVAFKCSQCVDPKRSRRCVAREVLERMERNGRSVPRLRMSAAIPLLPLYAFMVCTDLPPFYVHSIDLCLCDVLDDAVTA
jgi:hypothetical protein